MKPSFVIRTAVELGRFALFSWKWWLGFERESRGEAKAWIKAWTRQEFSVMAVKFTFAVRLRGFSFMNSEIMNKLNEWISFLFFLFSIKKFALKLQKCNVTEKAKYCWFQSVELLLSVGLECSWPNFVNSSILWQHAPHQSVVLQYSKHHPESR